MDSDSSDSEPEWIPYTTRREWKNVKPMPQNDGPEPVVPIEYTDRFQQTMDYFRAIVHAHEVSDRAYELCDDVVTINPANYVAWYYRRQIVYERNMDIRTELSRMRHHVIDCSKNYQVWYHRRELLSRLAKITEQDAETERNLIDEVFLEDQKHYHAWSHRRWLIQTFQLWEHELERVAKLIDQDVRNNSAWNFRYFIWEHSILDKCKTDEERGTARIDEARYVFQQIDKAKNNASPYNYLFGLLPDTGTEDFWRAVSFMLPLLEEIGAQTADCIASRCTLFMCHSKLAQCRDVALATDYDVSHTKEFHYTQCVQLAQELMELDKIRYKYWNYQAMCNQEGIASITGK